MTASPSGRAALPCRALLAFAAAAAAAAAANAFVPPAGAAPASGFTVWRVAGDGIACGGMALCGDGGLATDASLSSPSGVALDPAGSLHVSNTGQNRVRRVSPAGVITTVAGAGQSCPFATLPCGDGGPATQAQLSGPGDLAVDAAGNVFIADTGDHRIRKVSAADGRISTVAGNGTQCLDGTKPCGDGGPATSASLNSPQSVAVDGAGSLYIADTADQRIRRVTPNGTITAFAGDGTGCGAPPNCGDGGPPAAAQLSGPFSVAVGPAGGLFIADRGDREVRQVAGGRIVTVAGDGTKCVPPACGDGGPATAAQITAPAGLAVGANGALFVSDSFNHQVRRVSPAGRIATVAGDGTPCASAPDCGDGGSATDAQLNVPFGVALDSAGNVVVADAGDDEVRWLAGPQAGPPGGPGTGGSPGPGGAPGTAGAPGRDGRTVLVAYRADVSARRVTVRYALTGRSAVTLRVTGPGTRRPVVVARRAGHAGLNTIFWNRRLARGRAARPGRYRLAVTATVAGRSATSTLSARLRAR